MSDWCEHLKASLSGTTELSFTLQCPLGLTLAHGLSPQPCWSSFLCCPHVSYFGISFPWEHFCNKSPAQESLASGSASRDPTKDKV